MKRLFAILFLVAVAPAAAQVGQIPTYIQPPPATSYTGPGDITNTFLAWGSCAFVYKASLAGSGTNMCDLVATGTTTPVVCTLRATSSGSVDLSLCADGVTAPATACASGCSISKAYDQTGHGIDLLGSGAATTYLRLVFNALGGQPCMENGTTGNNLASTATMGTGTAPFIGSAVAKMASTTSSGAGVINVQSSYGILWSAANTWGIYGSVSVPTFTASDNAFHAVQVLFNGPSSASYVDGTSTSPLSSDPGGLFLTGRVFNIFSRGGQGAGSYVCEGGWSTGNQSGNFAALNANQHTRYAF